MMASSSAFLASRSSLALVETLTGAIKAFCLLLHLCLALADALFAELNLEGLVLDFLGRRFKLAVVAHVVLLLGVLFDQRLAVLDLHLVGRDALVHLVVVVFHALEAGTQAFQLILQVLHFQGKFAANDAEGGRYESQ